ncbi:Endosulphine protein [Spatholobus suberectus]|nr:Endosulphine protein [Spatholobus suberectus]
MSEGKVEDVKKEEEVGDDSPKNEVDSEKSVDDLKDSDKDKSDENPMPSSQQEEEAIKKKYGGMLLKKPPLISKDHERAYFDSADWALGKQGTEKPKGPLEALRPKLQPTQQHARSRRSAYAPADGTEDGCNNNMSPEHQSATEDVGSDKSDTAQDQSCH